MYEALAGAGALAAEHTAVSEVLAAAARYASFLPPQIMSCCVFGHSTSLLYDCTVCCVVSAGTRYVEVGCKYVIFAQDYLNESFERP